ncbi:hypothetical protein [Frigoribacterium sp. ACAM 257]|uniref:hypothetical protein n=1 Tax=Frigoribacterium sp. ACAM 257 TaxID=2508998 RepID=UPI0011BFD2A1|nr:hypothetical protein [Frigoribacterium sp. ACAM 257]
MPQNVVANTLRIPAFPRAAGGGISGGGGSSSGRQQSPRRNAREYAATAGRAANLARALRAGDREALERAGLDFDALQAMPSRAEMVRTILEVVCEAHTSSDIPSEEQREIASRLLDWMLDEEQNPTPPTPSEAAEYAIGIMIAEMFLSEAGEFTSNGSVSREDFVNEVYEAAANLASRAELTGTTTGAEAIEAAITRGLRFLRRTYASETQ